jgi:hypothetical protein
MEKPTFKKKKQSDEHAICFFLGGGVRTLFLFLQIQEELVSSSYQKSRHIYADAHRGLCAEMVYTHKLVYVAI